MLFTTTTRAKDLNGLRFKFSFSIWKDDKTNEGENPNKNIKREYEKMKKLIRVKIRIVEENGLRLITMNIICNDHIPIIHIFYRSTLLLSLLHSKILFHHFSSLKL